MAVCFPAPLLRRSLGRRSGWTALQAPSCKGASVSREVPALHLLPCFAILILSSKQGASIVILSPSLQSSPLAPGLLFGNKDPCHVLLVSLSMGGYFCGGLSWKKGRLPREKQFLRLPGTEERHLCRRWQMHCMMRTSLQPWHMPFSRSQGWWVANCHPQSCDSCRMKVSPLLPALPGSYLQRLQYPTPLKLHRWLAWWPRGQRSKRGLSHFRWVKKGHCGWAVFQARLFWEQTDPPLHGHAKMYRISLIFLLYFDNTPLLWPIYPTASQIHHSVLWGVAVPAMPT